MTLSTLSNLSTPELMKQLDTEFANSNTDFARAYYLFATAKLSETYNSSEIYAKYPNLHSDETFKTLKTLYDKDPGNEKLTRLFTAVLGSYIGNQLSELSDAYQNLKNKLEFDVSAIGLNDAEGQSIEKLLYEDVSEWLKKLEDKQQRQALYDAMAKAHRETLAPKFIELFEKENQLLADLGYADVIQFYTQTSGHQLRDLALQGKQLVDQTQDLYTERMSAFYQERTGLDFSQATRADISYVLHRPTEATKHIDARFPQEKLVPLAQQTFDQMGLNFSKIARTVDFASLEEYDKDIVQFKEPTSRILLDISHRAGKRSRAYVYPSKVPSEIYLSVKPEGGLDDYSAFFHESGHAQHFAYTNPELGFAMAQMGNNTVTEAYAYLCQNLFLNRLWLVNQARLSVDEAQTVVRRGALNDLYMLRRYASKMQFEIALYDGVEKADYTLADKGKIYAELLTRGCGYQYDESGWSRDVDAGFYVADYFTAWSLEAQLRDYLCKHYGNAAVKGEDWYANPKAGEFLKTLWKEGNLPQQTLAEKLGYQTPNDITPLVSWMNYNLG